MRPEVNSNRFEISNCFEMLFCLLAAFLAAFDNEQDSLNFWNFWNNRHPNFIFTIEKQINHSIAFLDVYISGINNQNLTLQTYYKSINTGLLLNFKSLTPISYEISFIKCLIHRPFKICNNWNSFHNDIENIKSNQALAWCPYCHLSKSRKRELAGQWKARPNIKLHGLIPPTQNSQ